MMKIQNLSRAISHNDHSNVSIIEQLSLRVKELELKARNHCVRLQQEKGQELKLIEFYEEIIRKYEF